MKKIVLIPFLFFAIGLSAAPIGQQRAKELALQFFAQNATRGAVVAVEMEWAGNTLEKIETRSEVNTDEALLYIFNRQDNGGWVIIAGDDNLQRPIIAFSDEDSFDVNNIADGTRWLLTGWCEQIAEARKKPNANITRGETDLSTGNVIVEIPTAKWNQGAPYNWLAPVFNGDRSVTGCVSTAISIVMRYFNWPDKGTGIIPGYTLDHEYGRYEIPDHELGYEYQWNKMLMEYHNGRYSTEQGNAVAQLMYDTGTGIGMHYTPGGSGAVTSRCCEMLAKYFKYGKGSLWIGQGTFSTTTEWYRALAENIANYGPTIGAGGGHAYVMDGYTDKYYFHMNHGWGGGADGYYYLPENGFTRSMGGCFYLEPDPEGTSKYRTYMHIVQLGGGNPWVCSRFGLESSTTEFISGQTIHIRGAGLKNASQGVFNGQIHLVLTDKDGNIKEVVYRHDGLVLEAGHYISNTIYDVVISGEIEVGDRLRYYYKHRDDPEWTWMRRSGSSTDEIIVSASAEEVAENLSFMYYKDTKKFFFRSKLATKYVVKNSEGEIVTEGKMAGGDYFNNGMTILMSSYEPGEYTISFTTGNDPYVLAVTL